MEHLWGCPPRMIHYTDALTELVHDIVQRVETLSFIDTSRLLLFARVGRTGASGAYATCHCLNLPTSDPGYYYWRDRSTGVVTKRTECFVTKTPAVHIGRRRLDYLISFAIPRFCDQVLEGSRKQQFYPGEEPWIAKLDTVVHELYHIGPGEQGLRSFERSDGTQSINSHGPRFLHEVACLVHEYLATQRDPRKLEFLKEDFQGLTRRFGGVAGTTFRNYPSYPQRYHEIVTPQPEIAHEIVVPIRRSSQPARYSEADLQVRTFTEAATRRLRKSEFITAA